MKKLVLIGMLCHVIFPAIRAQATADGGKTELKIPMTSQFWEYDPKTTEFITHRGVKAVQGVDGGFMNIRLKDHDFTTGTIEFDVELAGRGFPGITFRMSEDDKSGENFYIRSFGPVSASVRTTLQYAAIIDGMSIWDLTDEYQAGATIHQQSWNHVKLVISENQMLAYVNNMERPALYVPELEGQRQSGRISLNGNVIFANFKIRPNALENVPSAPGYISTYNDSRYLRNWLVTPPVDFPAGQDITMPLPSMYGKLVKTTVPDSSSQWSPIRAEARAIVNLSRKFGSVKNDLRRLAWLKTTIRSDKAQEKILNLGFSDEVWVLLNGQILYVDKNYFGTPGQKEPKGRCTIENTSFRISLKEGDNELLIGLANYFYGWGIIARLNNMEGIEIQ